MWPKESISLLAPRAALLCEGTSFKKVSKLPAEKLKSNDESGVQLLVATLGGSWGRSEVERKYDVFEKAIFGTIQKSDESNDSYLARHDVHFEELLAQSVSLEEVRAYVLLRQSASSAEDRKKIVVEMGGTLKYDKVSSAIRLLGSRFFSDLQGQRGAFRNKTYDANMVDEKGIDDTDRVYHTAAALPTGEDYEPELEPEYLEALIAAEDQDALTISSFEDELETFFQDTPELQEALVSYLEARSRLLSKRKVRGFWPVSGAKGAKAAGKGGKGQVPEGGEDEVLTRLPEEAISLAEAFSVALQGATAVEAILDTGASRCVMGQALLDRTVDRQILWLGVEIVPGSTPLLFSKRAIKQLGATGLYMLDLAGLSEESCQVQNSAFTRFRKYPESDNVQSFSRLKDETVSYTLEQARTIPLPELGRVTISFGKQQKGRTFQDVVVNEESWVRWCCDHLGTSSKHAHKIFLVYVERHVQEAEALEEELLQTTETEPPASRSQHAKSKAAPRTMVASGSRPTEDHWDMIPDEETSLRVDAQVNDLRIHVNLGHPPPGTLARHLQAANADPRLIVREFNDLVGVDGRRAASRHATDAIQAINDFWISWAGPPKQVYLDPAGEFRSEEVLEYFQGVNVKTHVTAAAWQRGRLERHGDILKDTLERLDISHPIVNDASFDRALLQSILAKNALVRHEGYSPEQIVFGKALRVPGSLTSDDDLTSHALAEGDDLEAERHRQRLDLRCLARKAFLEADNSQTIRRAALRRSTPLRGPFNPGMWVLYWTKKSSPNRLAAGRWHGPAKVICAEGKSIVWVAHGTTIIRSAPENLRPASLREWQSLTDSQLDQPWRHTGGASSFLDLTGVPGDSPTPENQHGAGAPLSASEILPMPVSSTAPPNNDPAPPVSEEIGQPEQELTPQVSQESPEVERDNVAAPSASSVIPEITSPGPSVSNPPDPQSIPVPGSDEGLCVESTFLASEMTGLGDDDGSELLNIATLEGDSEACGPPLAEDNLPYVPQPLLNTAERAYCLEVPLKPKEVKRWKREESASHLIAVAAAMKRARSEVCLKDLSAKELELFDLAKQKEINCWVQTSAIRGILRRKLNPEQILKSRWILTWKPPEEGETQQRAKARLVVLGFQDPKLTEVSRDAPTLSKEGRAVVLQTIASRRFQLSSFDIKTAFLRGKADATNPLAMEPPKELRKALSLRDDEVCELLGNAYGRVDAPLLFYKELSKQLFSLGMHVDDGVGGGDEVFRKKIDELQKTLPFGSRKFDSFTFTGALICATDEKLSLNQEAP
ncbi:RE2, partial [Symbiodinium necroappetens]